VAGADIVSGDIPRNTADESRPQFDVLEDQLFDQDPSEDAVELSLDLNDAVDGTREPAHDLTLEPEVLSLDMDDPFDLAGDGEGEVSETGVSDGVEEVVPDGTGEPDLASIDGDGDGFTPAEGDCDDSHPDIYPGSEIVVRYRDYDCDDKVEYQVSFWVTVDDEYEFCVDGDFVGSDATWSDAERYDLELESGPHVIGINGIDSAGVITGMATRVVAGGYEINSHGSPTDGIDSTAWRYYPLEDEGPQLEWCQVIYDDSLWGPALFNTEIDDDSWHENPDSLSPHEVDWIWDGRPSEFNEAWFRRSFYLPDEEIPVPTPPETPSCDVAIPEALPPEGTRLHNGVAVAFHGTQFGVVTDIWADAWREGDDQVYFHRLDVDGLPLSDALLVNDAGSVTAWNTFPDIAASSTGFGVVFEDGRHGRYDYDQIYFNGLTVEGVVIGADQRVTDTTAFAKHPSITSGPDGGWLTVWQDERDGHYEIYGASISNTGVVGEAVRLTVSLSQARRPDLAYLPESDVALVVWQDTGDGNREVYGQRFNGQFETIGDPLRVTETEAYSGQVSVVAGETGDAFGLVYADESLQNREIFFVSIGEVDEVSEPIQVTQSQGISTHPEIAATDEGWGIVFRDDRFGQEDIFLVEVTREGVLSEHPTNISNSTLNSINPHLAYGEGRYLVVWEEQTDSASEYYYPYYSLIACP
jgi:hypothetical protein